MIHAYRENYLSNAQSALGEAFDYAINTCKIPGEQFINLFVVSSISKKMENAEPSVIAGKSGVELVKEIMAETTGKEPTAESSEKFSRSAEYWIGWVVAYYQWWSGKKYSTIFKALSFDDLHKMYFTLHEADVSKFADIADARIKEIFPETNLKRIRTYYGCSQAELAKMSGVSLRSIQMYEQRNKDINKASADTLYRIARTLGCEMEDLIQK
ncbi:MAG: helix-turn-helix transcriptional regulator [Lachnospiraceae bacterium]|nr:helix-turn-helix transcriptional regulator [Lachnospiraceae bacterium]MDO4939647.1 helix-turn-helix transcriptional regulator [Lachnospiraceae bacterium]